jgi:hypothetical protein
MSRGKSGYAPHPVVLLNGLVKTFQMNCLHWPSLRQWASHSHFRRQQAINKPTANREWANTAQIRHRADPEQLQRRSRAQLQHRANSTQSSSNTQQLQHRADPTQSRSRADPTQSRSNTEQIQHRADPTQSRSNTQQIQSRSRAASECWPIYWRLAHLLTAGPFIDCWPIYWLLAHLLTAGPFIGCWPIYWLLLAHLLAVGL